MIDSVPYFLEPVDFTDWGARDASADGSWADIGQMEMLPTQVVVQYSHALSMPWSTRIQERADIPGFPPIDYDFKPLVAPPPVTSRKYNAQDLVTPIPTNDLSLIFGDLAAPPIETGNSTLGLRC